MKRASSGSKCRVDDVHITRTETQRICEKPAGRSRDQQRKRAQGDVQGKDCNTSHLATLAERQPEMMVPILGGPRVEMGLTSGDRRSRHNITCVTRRGESRGAGATMPQTDADP